MRPSSRAAAGNRRIRVGPAVGPGGFLWSPIVRKVDGSEVPTFAQAYSLLCLAWGLDPTCGIDALQFTNIIANETALWARSLHGSGSAFSGGIEVNSHILKQLNKRVPGQPLPEDISQAGLIDRIAWNTDWGQHSQHTIKSHQFFQKNMLRRAWRGGLRLVGLDVLDSRIVSQALGGADYPYDEWRTIERVVKRVEKLVACPGGPLCHFAGIAKTPAEAR